ncbi:MAG: diaminopropionate ammonia-lyase [Rhodobacteraceae bacterium]|nr:diaminopropionate ammonia-lyase [Paracoccaceae bacterium]
MKRFSHFQAQLELNPAASNAGYGPRQAKVLSAGGLTAAKAVIEAWPGYQATPLFALPGLAASVGVGGLHYKDEAHRFGLKSFKPLGGAYAVARMLMRELLARGIEEPAVTDLLEGRFSDEVSKFTVTAATDGNHGRSVAWGARMFGCRCVIFINEAVSQGREDAIAFYGAEVRRNPGSYDDAVRKAQTVAAKEGWFVIPDTSDDPMTQAPRDVTQGYAVMASEAIEQLANVAAPTHIFLQAGVGGMAAATCAQFWQAFGKDRPKTILVEPVSACCWFESLRAGHPITIDGELDSLMGGLACGEVSRVAWEVLVEGAHAMMTLQDEAAAECMRLLANAPFGDPVIVAGESGVAGLAGFLTLAEDPAMRQAVGLDERAHVLVFGTEGATDPETYAAIVGKQPENLFGKN